MPVRRKGAPRIVATEVRQFIGRARREIVLEACNILQFTTPVATGHAKNNWIPSIGLPSNEISGSRQAPSAEAQQRGIREVMDEPLDSRRAANLVNNVEYITHLNEGSSQQAPTGFVQAAIAQAIANVKARLGKLRRKR